MNIIVLTIRENLSTWIKWVVLFGFVYSYIGFFDKWNLFFSGQGGSLLERMGPW